MKLVDLSQNMGINTPRSSDHPEVQFPVIRWFSMYGIKTRQVIASLHSGTHIDAPLLYYHDGRAVHELPLDGFCGTAVVIDAQVGQWGAIDAEFLEKANPEIMPGDMVVLYTGWGKYYLDEETYVLKAPGLSKSGVDWLVQKAVKAVCSDSPSPEHIFMRSRQWKTQRPDIFDSAEFAVEDFPPAYGHKQLLGNDIMMVEHLSDAVSQFVGQRINMMALPIKYENVEAAPARVVAITEFP